MFLTACKLTSAFIGSFFSKLVVYRVRDTEGSQTGRSATRDSSRDMTLSDPDQDGVVSAAKKKNGSGEDKSKDQPPILKYLRSQVSFWRDSQPACYGFT